MPVTITTLAISTDPANPDRWGAVTNANNAAFKAAIEALEARVDLQAAGEPYFIKWTGTAWPAVPGGLAVGRVIWFDSIDYPSAVAPPGPTGTETRVWVGDRVI